MEALVGILVGAAALYLWGWRRFRFIGAYWKRHEQMKKFEQALRDARAGADGPNPFRIATAADAPHVERLAVLVSQQAALAEAGFRVLGDLIMERDGKAFMISRVHVSGEGTTLATLSASLLTVRTYVGLGSYDGDSHVSTVRGEVPSLARPPFVTVTSLPQDASIAKLVAAHQPMPGARVVTSLDDVLARLAEVRTRTQAWRAAQPPDELLDADLRALLGKAYENGAKRWAARLRDKLPQATARRV